LPQRLINFLSDPTILKVGRVVRGDVKHIKNTFNVDVNGEVDIGPLAYSKGYVSSKNASLTAIAEAVLKKSLAKDIRTSCWSVDLTPDQQNYAALDAWISLQLYTALEKAYTTVTPGNCTNSTPVVLCRHTLDQDHEIIARGHIRGAPMPTDSWVKTKGARLVEITHVIRPDYKNKYKRKDGKNLLSQFGPAPFTLLVDSSCLFLADSMPGLDDALATDVTVNEDEGEICLNSFKFLSIKAPTNSQQVKPLISVVAWKRCLIKSSRLKISTMMLWTK
jgi:hypothetical protein